MTKSKYNLAKRIVSPIEFHLTSIETIQRPGAKTVRGYLLATSRYVQRHGYVWDYGYVGEAKEVYLDKGTRAPNWETARELLRIDKETFDQGQAA